MSLFRQYATIIGLVLLALVVIVLLSTPDVIFSKGVSVIDTELSQSSGADNYVRTKIDFGDIDHMNAFPRQIGEWEGFDYDTDQMAETLGADVMLMRGYTKPGIYLPIFFLIVQGKDRSTFHPPPVCYPSIGYTIQEEGSETIPLAQASWAEEYEGELSLGDALSAKKLVVFKESDGAITERRLVLYFYVKQNPLNPFASDTVTMIRVSALIPTEGSYEGMRGVLQDFTAESIPHMFDTDPDAVESSQRLVTQLAQSGVPGYLGMVALLTLPIAIVLYPRIIPRRNKT